MVDDTDKYVLSCSFILQAKTNQGLILLIELLNHWVTQDVLLSTIKGSIKIMKWFNASEGII